MRYISKQKDLRNRLHERRTVRKFLFWPRSFDYSTEGRWLEFADIVEEVEACRDRYYWKEIAFANHKPGGEKQ